MSLPNLTGLANQPYQKNLGYFISYEHLFSTWLAQGSDFNIAHVRTAMSAFSQYCRQLPLFWRYFRDLRIRFWANWAMAPPTNQCSEDPSLYWLPIFRWTGKQGYDVWALFMNTWLVCLLPTQAKAGDFIRRTKVSLLMSEIIADHLKIVKKSAFTTRPAAPGSLLINIGHSVAKHLKSADSHQILRPRIKENTYNLPTRMNLVMRGIFTEQYFHPQSIPLRRLAAGRRTAVSGCRSVNPPIPQPWNPRDKEGDIRLRTFWASPRRQKPILPFYCTDLFHLKPDGIPWPSILPHGCALFRGWEEKIRKIWLNTIHIDAIIGLPANIFSALAFPPSVSFFSRAQTSTTYWWLTPSKRFIKWAKTAICRQVTSSALSTVTHRRELP